MDTAQTQNRINHSYAQKHGGVRERIGSQDLPCHSSKGEQASGCQGLRVRRGFGQLKGTGGSFLEMFLILILVMDLHIHIYVKIHRTVH